jgi:hypothetical protein
MTLQQGATTKDWQRQFEEEQRRCNGWIVVSKPKLFLRET